MNNLLRTGFWIGMGAGIALLLAEAVLRLLPVAGRGVYAAAYDPSWPVNHLLPNSRYTYSVGWSLDLARQGAVNNMGYVAPFDFTAGAGGVAVLGDSYIENLMNDYAVTLQGRLPALLDEPLFVLPFGSSGASMPDYLAVARMVAERFHPHWGVVLISAADFTEGFAPVPGYYGWDAAAEPPVRFSTPGERGLVARVGRQSALVRYLRYNLKATSSSLVAWRSARGRSSAPFACTSAVLQPADDALVARFARELPLQFRLPAERIIVVFDADRNALYGEQAGTTTCPTRDQLAHAALRRQLHASGVHVVETGALFAGYYHATGRRVDYSPLDWHWNGEAHRLVAQQVAAVINTAHGFDRPPQVASVVLACSHAERSTPGGSGCAHH